MAYTPTTWETGDIITATKLNNIESGVQSVSSSYTPTTWDTGDIITAVKLNNIEQGIANASGGSSDFSTAEVTVTNSTGFPLAFYGSLALQEDDEYFSDTSTTVMSEENVSVIMYKGIAYCNVDTYDTVSTTGNILFNEGIFTITGDGTITFSSNDQ